MDFCVEHATESKSFTDGIKAADSSNGNFQIVLQEAGCMAESIASAAK